MPYVSINIVYLALNELYDAACWVALPLHHACCRHNAREQFEFGRLCSAADLLTWSMMAR